MKKVNNKKYFLIGGLCVLLVLLFVLLLFYFNNSKNNYSFSEKNWINNNANNVIDVSVEGNLPIFSNNGEGVFYDYLTKLEIDTGLEFNINVDGISDYSFVNKNVLDKNDLVFYTDHYVVVSTVTDYVSDISSIKSQTIGVLSEDLNYVSEYLSSYGLGFETYEDINSLSADMNVSVVYAIIPMYKYMNDIVYSKYNIVHHIEGLHSHYVLSMKDASSTLSSIYEKFFNKWENSLNTSINKHFLSLYYTAFNLSDLEKETVTGDDLIIGYIDNMPFEGKVNNKFSGLTGEYLNLFADLTGATYKYIEYSNVDELVKALNNKKVDIVMNYYNVSNNNYEISNNLGNISYVIVAHQDNIIPVENLNSVKDDIIKMVNNTKLYSFIKGQNFDISVYDSYEVLFEEMEKDDILIVEKSTYDYYKNSELKNYVIKYLSDSNVSDVFLLNKENTILNEMFNFYISVLGVKRLTNMAVSTSLENASNSLFIQFLLSNLTYILVLVAAVVFLLFKFNRKVKVTKRIRKEDKMMYLDVMTNLKNRNYLNDNLSYWESNKVYPQAVVIVDLNSISVINDTKGHEEGDKQIKSAASILIKTQRENSEIIRTDGNEFLIYMVGYDDKQIVTYINKLIKEFKNLPYEYGASIGYYLINSESTTIDDAINEAIIKMRENKGE